MSTPNGAKVRQRRRTVSASAVIIGLVVFTLFAFRSTHVWERDLDRSLQSVQRTR